MVEEPPQSDDSSSYSMTLSEFEEDRWYNPTSLSDDAAEIESIQRLIKYIRVITLITICAYIISLNYKLSYHISRFNRYNNHYTIIFTTGGKSNGYGNRISRIGRLQSSRRVHAKYCDCHGWNRASDQFVRDRSQ